MDEFTPKQLRVVVNNAFWNTFGEVTRLVRKKGLARRENQKKKDKTRFPRRACCGKPNVSTWWLTPKRCVPVRLKKARTDML